MKTHTQYFKNQLSNMGRQIDSIITYGNTTLHDELYGVSVHYEGDILKSVMKQLDIESSVSIPTGTLLNYQLGVKVGNAYEYLNYGNYIVYNVEKIEDANTYKIICYDKLLYAMHEYEALGVTYPITVRNYINALCTKIGLEFKDINTQFANYNKEIQKELYLDTNGNSLGYTYRDVLDELAQVTASIICIDTSTDKLQIKYPTQTNDTINEDFLKDVNVKFGEKYGAINTIVLSRSAGADNIYYPETLPENIKAIKISDNQIMNWNDRDTYLPAIYNKLNGLEYYINDFSSIGVLYYELGDFYNITVGETTYKCLMLNDEINVTQGIEEIIHSNMPEEAETDYSKADKTDRRINQTYLIVDKQNQQINAVITRTEEVQKEVNNITNTTGQAEGKYIYIDDSAEDTIISIKLNGETSQEGEPSPGNECPIKNLEGKNILNPLDYLQGAFSPSTGGNNDVAEVNNIRVSTKLIDISKLKNNIVYSGDYFDLIAFYDSSLQLITYTLNKSNTIPNNAKYCRIRFYNSGNELLVSTVQESNNQLQEGTVASPYVPYNSLEVKVTNEDETETQTVYFPLEEGQKLYEGSYLADDGIHHKKGQYVFTGEETLSYNSSYGGYRFDIDNANINSTNPSENIICSHFKTATARGSTTGTVPVIRTYSSTNVNKAIFLCDGTSDISTFKTFLAQQYANGTPVTIEFDLEEEEIIPYNTEQQATWNKTKELHTYKNITNIYSDAYAEIEYVRDNGLDIYETKANANNRYTETTEKFAQQQITNESITNTVSQTITTVANNYNELKTKFDDYAPVSDVISLQTSVNQIMTDTYTKTEINEKLTDGSVTKVSTTAGTFDSNGLTIEKTDAKTKGNFNHKGIEVIDTTSGSNQELLFAGYDENLNETIVRTNNLTVRKYFTLENVSRQEKYVNPVLGGKSIGTFIL